MCVWQVRPSNPVSRATSTAARLWGSQEVWDSHPPLVTFTFFTLHHIWSTSSTFFTFSPPGPYHRPPSHRCWGLSTTPSPSLIPSSSPDSPPLTRTSPSPTTSLHLVNKKLLGMPTRLPLLHHEDCLAQSLPEKWQLLRKDNSHVSWLWNLFPVLSVAISKGSHKVGPGCLPLDRCR